MNDKTIFVVAGGPSLIGFDFNRLKGKQVMVINKSLLSVPFADYLYFSDYIFYEQLIHLFKPQFEAFTGTIYTIAPKVSHPRIITLKTTGKYGIDYTPFNIRHGGNSSYACINLIYHLGFKQIIFLGLDMKLGTDGRQHHHEEYPDIKVPQPKNLYPRFMEPFRDLVNCKKDLGIDIVNTSLNSALPYLRKDDISNYL